MGLATKFRGYEKFVGSFLEESSNQFFASPTAVHIRRIQKVTSRACSSPEDFEGTVLVHVTPAVTSQLPTAQTYLGSTKARRSERSLFHCSKCLSIENIEMMLDEWACL
jgi:hypothetical protein